MPQSLSTLPNAASKPKHKVLFLDRDGVINVNHGYVHKADQVDWVPGIFELVKQAKKLGYLVIVVTNQSGIARAYYTESEFWTLMHWMQMEFAQRGGLIDQVYFCPHHPSEGKSPYVQTCHCRKPGIGMIQQAMQAYSIDLRHSVMVGDKALDMQMAANARIGRAFLLNSENIDLGGISTKQSQITQIKHLNQVRL